MKQKRPVNLALNTISFPAAAIASILHRISGVVVYLLIPFMLWLLEQSLISSESFQNLQDALTNPVLLFLLLGLAAGLIYHLLAGIRHLLMDAHYLESLEGGRKSAILVIVLSIILFFAVIGAFWLW